MRLFDEEQSPWNIEYLNLFEILQSLFIPFIPVSHCKPIVEQRRMKGTPDSFAERNRDGELGARATP